MKLTEAQEKFVQAWGTLGSNWGINKTMGQIHAQLLIAHEPLTAEELIEKLNISSGNANMNIRALIDWGLVSRTSKQGDRKDYFIAEKDVWKITRQVIAERRKREIEPMLRLLEDVREVDAKGADKNEYEAFSEVVSNIGSFASKANSLLEKTARSDSNWFINTIMKLVK